MRHSVLGLLMFTLLVSSARADSNKRVRVTNLLNESRTFSAARAYGAALLCCELALEIDPFSAPVRAEREKILHGQEVPFVSKDAPHAAIIQPTFPPKFVRPVAPPASPK